MSVSEPFIRRPVGTSLLTLGLLLAGKVGYDQLPISALPQVDYPTILVSTVLPGASAETMASAVTTPLERQFGQMPSLEQMTSVSSFGSSQITLQFNLERNIDAAEQDVQAAINAASNLLPRTLPAPPTYSKSNPADTPILTLAVSSSNRWSGRRRCGRRGIGGPGHRFRRRPEHGLSSLLGTANGCGQRLDPGQGKSCGRLRRLPYTSDNRPWPQPQEG